MSKKIINNNVFNGILARGYQLYVESYKLNIKEESVSKIIFTDLEFNEALIINFHSQYKVIQFVNCDFLHNCTIESEDLNVINFTGCKLNDLSTIIKGIQCEISINESKIKLFKADYQSGNGKPLGVTIIISNNSSIEEVNIAPGIHSLTVKKSKVGILNQKLSLHDLSIDNSTVEEIHLENCKMMNFHIVMNSQVQKVFSHLGSIGIFEITTSKINNLFIGQTKIDIFTIKFKSHIQSIPDLRLIDIATELSFEKSLFDSIQFYGASNENVNVNIEGNKIRGLEFNKFINNSIFKLKENQFTENGEVIFDNSDLGQMQISYSDLSKCNLKFQNSKISDIEITGVDFPTRIYNVQDKNKTDHIQAKHLFGTLSNIYGKNGDSVREYEYHAREIHEYYKSISLWSDKWISKATLWLNYQSNNFGRNWGKGVRFTLVVSIIGFQLMILASGYTWTFEFNPTLAISFLKFVNPIRVIDIETLLKRDNIGWEAYLVDFICRILIAYGYYQTIQAFRKFGKQ